MGATRWSNRSITTAHEQALVFCADFAAFCRRTGDPKNAYRWKCVLYENLRFHTGRLSSPLRSSNDQAQLPLM